MNYYAHGGLANAAQHLAQKGRNGDTQLVHVSPSELHGLHALAKANGTSITINPDTGLPEAFNFKKLLPMVAGAALTIGSGGTLTPLMAAGIVGGGYAVGTGSIQKGLMAGIGAYGGAGLGAGLAEAGVSNLVETGGQEALKNATAQQITEEAAKDQIIKSSLENQTMDASRGMFEGASRDAITSQQIAQTQAQNAINSQAFPNLSSEGISGLKAAVPNAANPMDVVRSAGMGNVANSAQVVNPTIGQSLSNVGSGIEQLGSSAGRSAVYSALPTGTLPALGATALDAGQKERASVPGYQEDEYDRRLKRYKLSPDYQAYQAPQPNPYYRPVYAAIGGIMNSNAPHSFDDESGSDNVGMATGGTNMAGGGIAGLGGYSDGGRMLKGPGDGMSDSIPGVIGGKQPARLADGEFVVPADVVSHLGNGSTDAGAKKLYSMMDKIRQARTGKKKQAPQVNVDKYLPMGKASGGITGYASGGTVGYADGGEIAAAYEAVLGHAPDPAGAAYWASTGLSAADIAKSLAASPEAKAYQPTQVQKIFNEQLGRTAEQSAIDFYTKALASGQSLADVSKGIAQSNEGQKMDLQAATSAYRQVLGRNPEPGGMQYWVSVAQSEGLTTNQLKDRIAAAAVVEQKARDLEPGTKFTQMQLDALGSDPFGGYYSEKSIYDVAPDAQNVSKIGDRNVQFTTPVTQQAVVSQFINGIYTAKQGLDVLNTPQAMAGLNVALANGSLSTKDYDSLVNNLNSAKTPAEVRAALSSPKAYVLIDAAYGQQIGEAANLAEAKREAAQRKSVLTGIDPGYYLSNQVLTDAYQKAGVSTPFQYDFYKNVDTRDTTSNLLTKDNFSNKKNELVDATRANPYRVLYDPFNPNNPNNLTPANRFATRDPYSDEGLKLLYGQMMGQYGTPNLNQVNPATQPYIGSTYKPPVPQRLLDEQNAKAAYDAKVAADKLAYENAPLTAENFDAAAYLKAYPEVGNRAVWQRSPYEHYLEATTTPGGNGPDNNYFKATKLPFTPTPYTEAPLFGSAAPATPATPATPAVPYDQGGARAGGLMSIKHRRKK
jgi:hypothetical protein